MSNKVVFGLEKVHVAMYDETTKTWETPDAIPGSVSLALSPEGDASPFYADDNVYYMAVQNNGYSGDLEMALVPDDILAAMLGWEVDAKGALVEIANAQPHPFALLFEVAGNEANKRYVFYHCTAARPQEEHETRGEKVEPATTSLSLTITPVDIDDVIVVKSAIERTAANATVFDSWFEAVVTPSYIS